MSASGAISADLDRVLVLGFATTGQAVASALKNRGSEVVAVDDRPAPDAGGIADDIGVRLVTAPSTDELAVLVSDASLVVVSPGVAPTHPVFALASEKVVSEIELAFRLSSARLVAITGTNGKTTVTSLVTAMLRESGISAAAVGNIGDAYISIVDDPAIEVAVCEVSSFQLAHTSTFRPSVATWLNLAEDHLDWHRDLDDYVASKEKIFGAQGVGDVAVVNAEDPIVMQAGARARSRVVTFGRHGASYRVEDDRFVGPALEDFGALDALVRHFPIDQLNALAAIATAREAGADVDACKRALVAFQPLPHRVSLVLTHDEVGYYDDSKATTPSAVIAALEAFSSVVLVAGGRNKGLDLGVIAEAVRRAGSPSLHGIVAIGEATSEVVEAFLGYEVVEATTMDEAVSAARTMARPGDAVLLSPGCASFDWYSSYAERGEDFARAVRAQFEAA